MRPLYITVFSFSALFATPIVAKPTVPSAPKTVSGVPLDAVQSITGLASKVLKKGSGQEHPKPSSSVTVHYTGWTTDGKAFDSSLSRGEPLTLKLNQVIRGWTEGLQLMVEGEKRRLWIPERLAYQGRPGAPKGMLVFDVELLKISHPPAVPKAPSDVSAVPADASRSKSGLASKILMKGTGTRHPSANSEVTVHYTGWTTDGKRFDSSVVRGAPATFPLNQVIAGWTEGLQLMVVGEKRRFWIPESLAYQGRPNRPQGMLVFDVELIAIK